jgi:hypothetical protein
LEHGGVDESVEHYRTIAYWYGYPGACLVLTDTLHVSDTSDELAHAYQSPDAGGVDTLTSRYEWGVDHAGGQEIYPATLDTGRHTTGTSTFHLKLRPDNWGVLLRRKLDYGFPNQRAQVRVADVGASFASAGTWMLAGSNTCLFSDPPNDTTPPTPTVETSNRQWRDDEFMIPWQLTRGRSEIAVQLTYEPVSDPLTPGGPVPSSAWSEYRYSAYCWVLP